MKLHGYAREQRGQLLLGYNDDPAKGPERISHLRAEEYLRYKHVTSEEFNAYFKFSFVRNPWARLVSEYKYRKHFQKFSFADFVYKHLPEPSMKDRYRHILPQYDFLFDAGGNRLVDYVGRFETLQQDFNSICSRLGIAETPLDHVGPSKRTSPLRAQLHYLAGRHKQRLHKSYRDFYDERLMQFVGAMYVKDIEHFNYSF